MPKGPRWCGAASGYRMDGRNVQKLVARVGQSFDNVQVQSKVTPPNIKQQGKKWKIRVRTAG